MNVPVVAASARVRPAHGTTTPTVATRRCGRVGAGRLTTKTAISSGGPDTLANCEALCKPCHQHVRSRRDAVTGRRPRLKRGVRHSKGPGGDRGLDHNWTTRCQPARCGRVPGPLCREGIGNAGPRVACDLFSPCMHFSVDSPFRGRRPGMPTGVRHAARTALAGRCGPAGRPGRQRSRTVARSARLRPYKPLKRSPTGALLRAVAACRSSWVVFPILVHQPLVHCARGFFVIPPD